jgi:ribonuclease G
METDLIINASENEVAIALLKDGKLLELHKEKLDQEFAVGDIYLGKIRKLAPGLNAAFVDVGYEKDAFLHYHDLGPQLRSLLKFMRHTKTGKQKWSLAEFEIEEDINKDGKIEEVLKAGQELIVQVAKEPISTKGPRISSEVSIPGRYLVLLPFSERISLSSKIEDKEERSRLKRLIQSIKPKGFGVIVRTVAQNKKVADLDADLTNLIGKWRRLHRNYPRKKAPSLLVSEMDRASAILRDLMNESFTNIIVDEEELFNELRQYVGTIAPEKEGIVKHYKDRLPIFEKYGIERQIKGAFGRSVSMAKGAYLIVEHTEALHVIDVNSGNRTNSGEGQENNALEVNLLAAKEIARQLRLRDMGGIIVVDFIDLQKRENRKALYDRLVEEMKDDRAKHKILPPSRFGLVEITRQRVRPVLDIKTHEDNPSGEGEVEAPILLIDNISQKLDVVATAHKKEALELHIHPFIGAYLLQGLPSIRTKWYLKYKKWIKVVPRDSYKYLEYHFLNAKGEEL